MRCFRCSGRKKLFKINNCYSLMDTGGVLVTCPMCNGEGTIVPLEKKLDELKKNNDEPKSEINNEIQKTKENNSRDERTIDFVDEERKSKLVGKKLQGKKGR